MMSLDRRPGLCGNKLLERLLPQGKFGNMDAVMHGCAVGVCLYVELVSS